MFPDSNLITSLLNITESDLENFNTRIQDNTTIYDVTLVRKSKNCPYCNNLMIGHGHKIRIINHPVLRETNGMIMYHANRYICKQCGKTAFEHNPFSFSNFNSSFLLQREVMKKLSNLNFTLDSISKELNISTTQINKYIDSFITIPPMPLPKWMGIDEIHSPALAKRKASYLCVLTNIKDRTVYDVLDSRQKQAISIYFSRFSREERLKVKYISIDMWDTYLDVAHSYFPNAIVAIDPFHVIQHLCRDFEDLRLSLMHQCEYQSNAYYLLKKWHWLLEKDDVNLDNKREFNHRFRYYLNRRDLKEMLLSTFPILNQAYELKELYRRFNRDFSYEEACERYDSILNRFKNSGIKEYNEFIGILENWKEEILNSFRRPYENRKLSNSFTENLNGKLKSYLTISRGLTNYTRFRKRIIYALNPDLQFALSSKLHSDSKPSKKRGPYTHSKIE